MGQIKDTYSSDYESFNYNRVIIYGAQMYAVSVYFALRHCNPDLSVYCFTVTDRNGNPEEIDKIPVIQVDDIPNNWKELTVIIATPEFYHSEIQDNLIKHGLKNIVPMLSSMQEQLLKRYFVDKYRSNKQHFLTTASLLLTDSNDSQCMSATENDFNEIKVYMAFSLFDKPLTCKVNLPSWIYPVQAGTALTSKRLCSRRDDSGENISIRNRNYCELTVAYWLWKNGMNTDYIGICHYRRYLFLNENHIKQLEKNNVDAILPYPMLIYPNAYSHHSRFVPEKDWNRMMDILRRYYPDYYKAADEIFRGSEFYLHNIWILNLKTASEFLEWLFSILFLIEKCEEVEGEERRDRHMGYLGENLTTLYFIYNRDRLNIYHTREIILN